MPSTRCLSDDNDVMRVVGPAPMGGDFLEIVIDEAPLRQAMLRFSLNILLLSLVISGITAMLVYLALHYLFVRPMRRITANMMRFRDDPENPARIIAVSRRQDEIGIAERELAAMQRDLASMLQQKSHLAALGLAVSKINHDLRNLLTSAQLFSDGLTSLPDPRVQRFAPKLMRALERAIAFCESTLSYGRAQEPPPDRKPVGVEALVEEVHETLALADIADRWITAIERGLMVDADPDQLFRVLLNLARNAVQALETRAPNDPARDQVRITGRREGAVVVIEVSDTGPGIPDQGARASVRGVPGLDAQRRHGPRPRHRGRAGARPWRRDPAGRGHHRGDLPHHHSGPRGRARRPPQRAGKGVTMISKSSHVPGRLLCIGVAAATPAAAQTQIQPIIIRPAKETPNCQVYLKADGSRLLFKGKPISASGTCPSEYLRGTVTRSGGRHLPAARSPAANASSRRRAWPSAANRARFGGSCPATPGDPCQAGHEAYSYAAFRALARGISLAERQAPVAQLDRALDYESRGREFESLRARQNPERNQALGGSSPAPFPYRSHKCSRKEADRNVVRASNCYSAGDCAGSSSSRELVHPAAAFRIFCSRCTAKPDPRRHARTACAPVSNGSSPIRSMIRWAMASSSILIPVLVMAAARFASHEATMGRPLSGVASLGVFSAAAR